MVSYTFQKEKAVNALLYIAHKISNRKSVDKYATLKILYFAEKKHLSSYGRLITNDQFAALPFGPVPSRSCNLLDQRFADPNFQIINNKSFLPVSEPDFSQLSESDLECLDEAISENQGLSFNQLKVKSHDKAYHLARDNGYQFMELENIARDAGADGSVLGYMHEYYLAQQLAHDQFA